MSSIVPRPSLGKIQFFEDHEAPWTANAVAIGTTAAAVTDLTAKTTAARAAYNTQQTALNTFKTATQDFHDAVTAMSRAGSDILKAVKAKAAVDGNNVYSLAQIPQPATPAPIGPPGTPDNFKVSLNPDGSLKLAWKCVNPPNAQGTTYQVYRKAAAGSDFVFIGASGARSFIDATLPVSSAPVTYQIRGVRSTAMGVANQFQVNFGTGGGGQLLASVVTQPRMAA